MHNSNLGIMNYQQNLEEPLKIIANLVNISLEIESVMPVLC